MPLTRKTLRKKCFSKRLLGNPQQPFATGGPISVGWRFSGRWIGGGAFRQELPHTLESLATLASSPFDDAVRRELAEHLRSAIAALPEREGAVFALRYFDHLSNPEIAEVLGVSTGAVAAAIHKVRAKLDAVLSHSSQGESR